MKRCLQYIPVLLLTSALLGVIYSDVIFNLNSSFFRDSGDGFKNYYNHAYHLKYDSTYFHFEGMNYPIGEVLPFVDIHPLLVTLNKFISNNVYDISNYTVGIINILLLFSVLITALFSYLILRFFKFNQIVSTITACGLAILSSNSLLWTVGHYGLGYSCFFPIAWYLLLRFPTSSKPFIFSILIALNVLIWSFTHLYLGAIIFGFTIVYWFFLFAKTSSLSLKKRVRYFLLQLIIPLTLVVVFYKFLDPIGGRVDLPFMTEYRARWSSILLPFHSFLRPIYELFFNVEELTANNWSRFGNYIGLSTTLLFISSFFAWFYFLVIKKVNKLKAFSPPMIGSLVAAALLLSFSMAFPFSNGLEFLLPDFIKQFRGLGRFAWAFYFVFIVFVMMIVRQVFPKKSLNVVFTAAGILLIAEGYSNHSFIASNIVSNANFLNQQSIEDIESEYNGKVHFSNYQAIIPMPFYHEYLTLHNYRDSEKIKNFSMQLSFATGLPLTSAILSRPSLIESKNVLQLLMPPYYEKGLKGIIDDIPFLIVGDKGEYSDVEKSLLAKAKKLHSNVNYEFYEIQVEDMFEYNHEKYLAEFLDHREDYQYNPDFQIYSKSGNYFYDDYNALESEKVYRGSGALQKVKEEFNIVLYGDQLSLEIGIPYELSFWYYNYKYDQTFNAVWIEIKNADNQIIHSETINPASVNIYDNNWGLNRLGFQLNNPGEFLVICSQGGTLYESEIFFDELLIRPKDEDIYQSIYSKDSVLTGVIKNNELIPLPTKEVTKVQ